MTDTTYLLDTSVTTRLHLQPVAERLRELDGDGIARTPITDLEMGFSAQNTTQWHTIRRGLSAFAEIAVTDARVARARVVQRLLAAAGLAGRKIPDLLIAAAAEDRGLVVVHYDANVDLIAPVTGQPSEWVAKRGSIS